MKLLLRFIAWYILVGAIGAYTFFMTTQTVSHIFSFLIPNVITTLVFAFYCFAAIRFIGNSEKTVNQDLLVIALLLQSILIDIGGFVFKNLYFPAYTLHINLKNLSESFFEFNYFTVKIVNGYFYSREEALLGLNIIELSVMFFCIAAIHIAKRK